jgi:hypothetical protein
MPCKKQQRAGEGLLMCSDNPGMRCIDVSLERCKPEGLTSPAVETKVKKAEPQPIRPAFAEPEMGDSY